MQTLEKEKQIIIESQDKVITSLLLFVSKMLLTHAQFISEDEIGAFKEIVGKVKKINN